MTILAFGEFAGLSNKPKLIWSKAHQLFLLPMSNLLQMVPGLNNGSDRIKGSGVMANRIRSFRWESTRLGGIGAWPAELVALTNMMLSSKAITAILWGPDMIMLYNDSYVPHLQTKNPVLGQPFALVWDDAYEQLKELFLTTFQTGKAFQTPVLSLMPQFGATSVEKFYAISGSPVWVETHNGSRISGIYQTAVDHTDSVLAFKHLESVEAQAQRVLQSIGEAVIVTDANGVVRRLNKVAERLTGWPQINALNEQLSKVCCIRDNAHGTSTTPTASVSTHCRPAEKILVARDGRETVIEYSQAPIYDHSNTCQGTVLVLRDIGERRKAELDRDQAIDQLRQIQDATSDEIIGIDRNWTITYLNQRAQRSLSACRAEVGRNFWETFPEAHYNGSPYVEHYTRAMEDGISSDFEAEYGAPLFIAVRVSVRPTNSGIALFSTNITNQRKKEAEALHLFRERQRFFTLAESSRDFIAMFNMEGKPIYGNPAARDMVGLSLKNAFEAAGFYQFIFPEDRVRVKEEFLPLVMREGHGETELRLVHQQSNQAIPISSQVFLLEGTNGEPFGFGTVSRDLTLTKSATATLIRNEKLAAVGRLASSIAHEINNPLASVMNLIYLARTGEDLLDVRANLEIADRELRRVAAISSQTLRFHKQSTSPTSIRLDDLVSEVLSMFQGRLINSGVTIQTRYRTGRRAECFEGEIRQVITNLIGNAIDSMQTAGGRLILRTKESYHHSSEQQGLVLTVADTGTGIASSSVSKIFDAFYSTKGIGGTGLGLWISKEIITRHKGSLRVRSRQAVEHGGTIFTLFLPCQATRQ